MILIIIFLDENKIICYKHTQTAEANINMYQNHHKTHTNTTQYRQMQQNTNTPEATVDFLEMLHTTDALSSAPTRLLTPVICFHC